MVISVVLVDGVTIDVTVVTVSVISVVVVVVVVVVSDFVFAAPSTVAVDVVVVVTPGAVTKHGHACHSGATVFVTVSVQLGTVNV